MEARVLLELLVQTVFVGRVVVEAAVRTLAQAELAVQEVPLEVEVVAAVVAQPLVAQEVRVLQEAAMSGPGKLNWSITPWQMNGQGGWKQQPVILVEGRVPFFADHPDAYIDRLQTIHDDPEVARGPFYTFIGQLRDAYEQAWNMLPELEAAPCEKP